MASLDGFCQDPFWNTTLLLNGNWPHFTECFQDTALVWVPCGFLWLFAPLHIWHLVKTPVTAGLGNPYTIKFFMKLTLVICLFTVFIVEMIHIYSVSSNHYQHSRFTASAVLAATMILAFILTVLERKKLEVTSGIQFLFWSLLLLCDIIPFYTYIELKTYETSIFEFSIFFIKFASILAEFILQCFPEEQVRSITTNKEPNPENAAPMISRIIFSWMTYLIILGYRNPLTESVLPDLHPRDKSIAIVPKFLQNWTRALSQAKLKFKGEEEVIERNKEDSPLLQNTKLDPSYTSITVEPPPKKKRTGPSLAWTLLKTLWWDFLPCQIWIFLHTALLLCNPLLTGQLVTFIQNTHEAAWRGYMLALALFVSSSLQSFFFNRTLHFIYSLGYRLRACLITTIFRKALTLDNPSMSGSTSGELVNLMSVDADNIFTFIQYSWAIGTSIVEIIISLYLLYNEVGVSMFAGAGFILLLVPLNSFLTNQLTVLQDKLLAFKDQRMKVMNEMLAGIKIIKLFAWEKSFEKKVKAIRNNELGVLYKFALLQAGFNFSWSVAPQVVSLLIFLTFVYTSDNHYLDPKTAFVAINLFNVMKYAINFAPFVVTGFVKAVISSKRIEKYLCYDDLDEDSVTRDEHARDPITIENGNFTWSLEDNQSTLKNINITIHDKSLVAIVGTVGAGKSSLLSAMLGEIDKLSGTVTVRGSVSYVPQQAWIQNNTLRNNILFGKEYNPIFYNKCVEACALGPDFQVLTNGDQTEIGEKGINLSGGQKQRVSLARAIYSQSDIYLLDDPLSAVDSHVGKHIFDKVLSENGLLAGKVRVLVTHGLHWLPHTDNIIVMTNGQVSEIGHYEELLSHKGDFAQLVKTFLLQDDDDEENADNEEYQEMKRAVLRTLSQTLDEDSDAGVLSDSHLNVMRQLSKTFEKSLELKRKGKELSVTNTVEADGGLIEEEVVRTGTVKFSVVKSYAKSIGYGYLFLIMFLYILYIGSGTGSNLWLSKWTDDKSLANFTELPRNSSERMDRNDFYLGIYGLWSIITTFAVILMSVIQNYRAVHASRILHNDMLARILHAPMAFFDTTPIGRIVNRFSKDLNEIDEDLPMTFNSWMDGLLTVLSSIFVISYGSPIFIAFILPLGILYFFFQRFYISTSRQLKRLSSRSKSPIFNHFSETVSGASVIRAFECQRRFVKESEHRTDTFQIFEYYNNACNRWLGIRLDFVGNLIIMVATSIAVATRDNISAGMMGLLVNYAMQATSELNWMVRMTSDLETQIVAVERIREYSEVDIEAPWHQEVPQKPLKWPHEGSIYVDHLSLRYRPGLDLVLKEVTFMVKGGEMLGIVGRTGAGKSSLVQALFRLIEPADGTIFIDSMDITTLGLHDLRSKITILPQDPVIFSGTLRQNLDPFDEYEDEALWKAITQCHLIGFVENLPKKLEHECGEGGENLSYGQRQLLCLGRALLHKSKILILDEATAAVDMETDELIQKTIREEFRDCTVLTIAHRLNTIMDYDRILVLEKGEVHEIDTPANLLMNTDGLFYSMAKSAKLV